MTAHITQQLTMYHKILNIQNCLNWQPQTGVHQPTGTPDPKQIQLYLLEGQAHPVTEQAPRHICNLWRIDPK